MTGPRRQPDVAKGGAARIDVERDREEPRLPRVEIEYGEARAGPKLARLPDRAGIEQHGGTRPAARSRRSCPAEPERCPNASGRWVCPSTRIWAPSRSSIRSSWASACSRVVVYSCGSSREPCATTRPRGRGRPRERGQKGTFVGAQHLLGPAQATSRELDAAAIRQRSQRDQVVIARHTGGRKRRQRRHALVRIRPVTDQVSCDEIAIDAVTLQGAQHGTQRVEVPVHVGEDSVAH